MAKMRKKEKPKPPDFILSKEALDDLLNSLKKMEPSIIGNTCQMLSALKITQLTDKEAFPFIVEIIGDLIKSGEVKLISKDQLGELSLDTLKKYLPKILEDPQWIVSIQEYIKQKVLNNITVEKRRGKKQVSPFLERKLSTGSVLLYENPVVQKKVSIRDTLSEIEINELLEKAKLTERQKFICILKINPGGKYTEELIAEIMTNKGTFGKVTRSIVMHDYKEAKDKLRKTIQVIRSKDKKNGLL